MSSDLVKRLRDVQTRERILGFGGSETLLLFSTEAADRIEALEGGWAKAKSERDKWHKAFLQTGACPACVNGWPDPHGCTDCLNTGWAQGSPTGYVPEDRLKEADARAERLEGEVAALKKTNAEWLKENAPGGWIDIFRSQAREYGARAERLRVALEEIKAFPQHLGVPTLTKLEDAFQRGLIAGHETCAAYARKALEDKQ